MEFECQASIEVSEEATIFVENRSPKVVTSEISSLQLGDRSEKRTSCRSSSKSFLHHDGCGNRRSIIDLPLALISEILNHLEPKELGIVSCVSTVLNILASGNPVWKKAYSERWGLPPLIPSLSSGDSDESVWKELFAEREFRSKTLLGQYRLDVLHGHTEAVRAVFVLSSAKLVFTSGYDAVLRMWDLEEGLSIASSPPLGCTIRAIAADTKLLLAGGTDGFIQGWRHQEGLTYLFNLKVSVVKLWEHQGPVTCIAMDLTRFYSGSWDMTIRIWDRSSLKCLTILSHGDWVWDLVPSENTICSASGQDVYTWDSYRGALLNVIRRVHVGNTFSLARSHTGNFLFTGGEDGSVHMFEIKGWLLKTKASMIATWFPHSGPVYSLAFEFPWLVSASSDGKISLIDVRKLLQTIKQPHGKNISKISRCEKVEAPRRMLHGFGSNLFSVDIGVDRIVCGGEEGVVRIWDFSGALDLEQRACISREKRLQNKMRKKKLQIEMRGDCNGICSLTAKKKTIHGDASLAWHGKRAMTSSAKLKA